MDYEKILKEIFEKAERADKIAGQVYAGFVSQWGELSDYGRGDAYGVDLDGVNFYYTSWGDRQEYSIPFHWLDYDEEKLKEQLGIERRAAERQTLEANAEREAKKKILIEQQERDQLARLKAKYES